MPSCTQLSPLYCPPRCRLQTVSGGKVPVIEYDGMQLPDSDKIVPYLEEKWPAAPMTATAPAEVRFLCL